MLRSHSRGTPFKAFLLIVLLGGLALVLRHRSQSRGTPEELPEICFGLSPAECLALQDGDSDLGVNHMRPAVEGSPSDIILQAAEVCQGTGYLCAEVEASDSLRILRWPDETPSIRVWVPLPEGVSPGAARKLQRAAANGIRVWHRHPFPLTVNTRSVADNPDITVEWARVLGENRLGRAEMRWSSIGEEITVEITGLRLATHYPTDLSRELSPEQTQLVAAHEMGHALGLPHSDDPRDVMFPQNTAWRRTQRDFQTMEALYRMPNGALIR